MMKHVKYLAADEDLRLSH